MKGLMGIPIYIKQTGKYKKEQSQEVQLQKISKAKEKRERKALKDKK